MSDSNQPRLHPIYAALDSQQYGKAIKLCLQQPHNVVAQALLAHAYIKAGQKYNSLLMIQRILGKDALAELQLAVVLATEQHLSDPASSAASPAPPPASSSTKKTGKKGKKKPSSAAPTSTTEEVPTVVIRDLIERFDTVPSLPDDWDRLPTAPGPTDVTLLSTLAMTMKTYLRLPLTVYQMYCWAAVSVSTQAPANPNALSLYLTQAFLSAFHVLVCPTYEHMTLAVLGNMQSLALQLARQPTMDSFQATSWAAQTALWQLQYNIDDGKYQQRLQLLPRLAESMASKCLACTHHDSLVQTEFFLLYLRTLDVQEKWEVKLETINQRLASSEALVYPPRPTLLDQKSDVMFKLGRHRESREIVEQLIELYPDNWNYWKRHLNYSLAEHEDFDAGWKVSRDHVDTVLNDSTQGVTTKYPLRGPLLMRIELSAVKARRSPGDSELVSLVVHSIKQYCETLSGLASCVFADVRSYLEIMFDFDVTDLILDLLRWLQALRVEPTSEDPRERRVELRKFICYVKLTYAVLHRFKQYRDEFLPDWRSFLKVWKLFQRFDPVSEDDQKESRPADDLILLAVETLTMEDSVTDSSLLFAAVILSEGVRYSPYNAQLKISALNVYGQLYAVSKAWTLFQTLFVKHIQNESCSFLILPLLRSAGMYDETILVCKEIIRLHRVAVHDAGDYSGRAMENGALSKADEFLRFQRTKLNRSLTTLEAKGLIMDAAPMYVNGEAASGHAIGLMHGIVGGPSDFERASEIVGEAHDPFGTFVLLQLTGDATELVKSKSENRDLSVLSYEILSKFKVESSLDIVRASLRRGRVHGILIRAALCLETTKGPKKGKVVPVSDIHRQRCRSLLSSLTIVNDDCGSWTEPAGYAELLRVLVDECRVITTVSSGMMSESDSEVDSLEAREESVVEILNRIRVTLDEARVALAPFEVCSVPRICRFVPECLIPVYSVFRMCAETLELFGWGRRKAKSKRPAFELKCVALALQALVQDMIDAVQRFLEVEVAIDEGILTEGLVQDAAVNEVRSSVSSSRSALASRMTTVLNETKVVLMAFDTSE